MLMGTAAPTKKQLDQYSSKKNTAQKKHSSKIQQNHHRHYQWQWWFCFLFGNGGVLSAQIFFICFIDFMSLTTSRHRQLFVADNSTSQAPSAVYAA
ncbi:hypothetical protein [Photobacterium ganghwense]|uniref:hypothetical protein n=1 Tax=Photobacterium ganghwense TaxID=320778 RepID=UPI0039EEDA85